MFLTLEGGGILRVWVWVWVWMCVYGRFGRSMGSEIAEYVFVMYR